MTAQSEMLGNRAVRGEEPLRVPGRLEPLHTPLPLTSGLVRVLSTVVQVPVLPMLHARQELAHGRAVALQLIRDEHPWDILTAFEELTEEFLRSLLVPPPLHQDVEHHAIMIDRPPEIVPLLIDRDEYFIQVPFVAWTRPATMQGIGID